MPQAIEIAVLDRLVGKILIVDQDGRIVRTLADKIPKNPDGIVAHPAGGKFFFTQMGEVDLAAGAAAYGFDGAISVVNSADGKIATIVNGGRVRTPKQIAVDCANGKIYWSDREGMRVMRSNFDGSDVETLYASGTYPEDEKNQAFWCVGIAVDPVRRLFYWTMKGHPSSGEGRILRASFDMPQGATPATRLDIEVLFNNLPEPIDLHLTKEALYWTDRGECPSGNSVSRAAISPNGKVSAKRKAVLDGVGEAIGIAIFEEQDWMFCSSLTGELYRARLDGREKVLVANFASLTGIART